MTDGSVASTIKACRKLPGKDCHCAECVYVCTVYMHVCVCVCVCVSCMRVYVTMCVYSARRCSVHVCCFKCMMCVYVVVCVCVLTKNI